MSEMENILCTSITILGTVIEYIIMIRIFLPIFNVSYTNPVMRFLYSITEPILAPARFLLDKIFRGPVMIDFSPIIVWLFLDIAVDALCQLVRYLIV